VILTRVPPEATRRVFRSFNELEARSSPLAQAFAISNVLVTKDRDHGAADSPVTYASDMTRFLVQRLTHDTPIGASWTAECNTLEDAKVQADKGLGHAGRGWPPVDHRRGDLPGMVPVRR